MNKTGLIFINNNIIFYKTLESFKIIILNSREFNENNVLIENQKIKILSNKINDCLVYEYFTNSNLLFTNDIKKLKHIFPNKTLNNLNVNKVKLYDYHSFYSISIINRINLILENVPYEKFSTILEYIDNMEIVLTNILKILSKTTINNISQNICLEHNDYINIIFNLETNLLNNKNTYISYNISNYRPTSNTIPKLIENLKLNDYSLDYKYSVLQLFNIYFKFYPNKILNNYIPKDYNKNKKKYMTDIFTPNYIYINDNNPEIINKIITQKIDLLKNKLKSYKNNKYIMLSPIFNKEYIVDKNNFMNIFYQLLETEYNALILKYIKSIDLQLFKNIILYNNDSFFLSDEKNLKKIKSCLNNLGMIYNTKI